MAARKVPRTRSAISAASSVRRQGNWLEGGARRAFAAQVQGGNVALVAGIVAGRLLDEMDSFPNGKYRDQVDACTGAFNRLVSGPVYNLYSAFAD